MQHRVLEYYQVCSNDDSRLTLTYFMARSNFVPYAFVWEKGKTIDIKPEMRSFKSNEKIHKKEGGSYYVVSANKASSVTL